MRNITVAAIQMRCVPDPAENLRTAERLVRQAAGQGAQVVLLPELFEREYFCQQRRYDFYAYATPTDENPAVQMGIRLARELHIVLPISFFERDCNNFYNTVACIDADGTLLGTYRKTHIPDDHYYQEKFYFTPGDTGFRVFRTKFGCIGVGICWDQWFPETARSMALLGAELLLYPRLSARSRFWSATPCPTGSAACRATPLQISCRSLRQTASARRPCSPAPKTAGSARSCASTARRS